MDHKLNISQSIIVSKKANAYWNITAGAFYASHRKWFFHSRKRWWGFSTALHFKTYWSLEEKSRREQQRRLKVEETWHMRKTDRGGGVQIQRKLLIKETNKMYSVQWGRTSNNRLKLQQGRFRFNIRKNGAQHRNRLLGIAVKSLSLEVYKSR